MRRLTIAALAVIGCLVGATPTLAAHWSIQRMPRPAANSSGLVSVTCYSSASCTAVGGAGQVAGRGLAEHWNGARWSIQHTPTPRSARPVYGGLEDVACPTATSCIATGELASRAVADFWNGLRWTALKINGLGRGANLISVSCPSPSACIAVGGARGSAPVAERWNGRRCSLCR